MEDWTLFAALAASLIAGLTLMSRMLDKGLSIREHEEFRHNVDSELNSIRQRQDLRLPIANFSEWRDQFRRDIDRLETALRILEQTRPTTGELGGSLRAFEERTKLIEERLRALNHKDTGR